MKWRMLKWGALSLAASMMNSNLSADQIRVLIKRGDEIPGFGRLVYPSYPFSGQANARGDVVFEGMAIPNGGSAPTAMGLIKLTAEGEIEIIERAGQSTTLLPNDDGQILQGVGGASCFYNSERFMLSNSGHVMWRPTFSGGSIISSVCGSNPSLHRIGTDLGLALMTPDGQANLLYQSGLEHPENPAVNIGEPTILARMPAGSYSSSITFSHLVMNSRAGNAVVRINAEVPSNVGGLYAFVGSTGELHQLTRVGRTFSQLPGYRVSGLYDTYVTDVGFESSADGQYLVQKVALWNPTTSHATHGIVMWSAYSPNTLRLAYVAGFEFNSSLNRWVQTRAYPEAPTRFSVSNTGKILIQTQENNGSVLRAVTMVSGRPQVSIVVTPGQAYPEIPSAYIEYVRNFLLDPAGRMYLNLELRAPNPAWPGGEFGVYTALRMIDTDGQVRELYNPATTILGGANPKFLNGRNASLRLASNASGAVLACGSHGPDGGWSSQVHSCHLFKDGRHSLVSESRMLTPLNSSRRIERLDVDSLIGINELGELAFSANTTNLDGTSPDSILLFFGQDKVLRQIDLEPQVIETGEIVDVVTGQGWSGFVGNFESFKRAGIDNDARLILHAKVYPAGTALSQLATTPYNMALVEVAMKEVDAQINVCPADFNESGTVSIQDLFDYLAAYSNRLSSADVNADGNVGFQDLIDFLRLYQAGGC